MTSDLAYEFTSYLEPGERVVWTGRPAQGLLFTAADILLVPFSLLWGGFAIFWEFSATAASAAASTRAEGSVAAVFPLFGVPFVLAGLYFIAGRFAVDAWVRSRMTYALTDQRALILRRIFGERLESISLRNAPQLRLTLHGRRGDLDFAPQAGSLFASRSFGVWSPSLDSRPRFIGIDDAAEVHRLAERARLA